MFKNEQATLKYDQTNLNYEGALFNYDQTNLNYEGTLLKNRGRML